MEGKWKVFSKKIKNKKVRVPSRQKFSAISLLLQVWSRNV